MDCHMLDPAQKAISYLSINLIVCLGFPKRTPAFKALKARLPPLPPLQRCFEQTGLTWDHPECYHSHCFSQGCFNNSRTCFIHIHNKALEECTFHLCYWQRDCVDYPSFQSQSSWRSLNLRKRAQKCFQPKDSVSRGNDPTNILFTWCILSLRGQTEIDLGEATTQLLKIPAHHPLPSRISTSPFIWCSESSWDTSWSTLCSR